MKKICIIIIIISVFLAGFFLFEYYTGKNITTMQNSSNKKNPAGGLGNHNSSKDQLENYFQPPLGRIKERISKKPFGIYITPKNSPVQPERFSGYHTGIDLEVFPEEFNTEVPIKAVCSGKLVMKKYAGGYGGVMVQSCELEKKPITVIYGHLKLDSIKANLGENIDLGNSIGILGADKSSETDKERKHLHLGFHRGSEINIRGYVQNDSELSDWVDPCLYLCQ